MTYWIIAIIIILSILAYLLDREIFFYEGTHLGSRVQGWLYDRWAAGYDKGKAESIQRDAEMLACPVLDFIKDIPTPLVLDLATGTGRLPLALLREPDFHGHIVAVDVSVGMLEQAAAKLAEHRPRVEFLHKVGYPLPFPDNSFDVVTCLEALEVMPEMESPLDELARILRPGGMLLTSRATDASGRKTKIRSVEKFTETLQNAGFAQVEVVAWWRWFDRAQARKPGNSTPGGQKSLAELVQCPGCGQITMSQRETGLQCETCGHKLPSNPAGIILS